MRVAFLSPVGELGGGERSLIDVVASLRETDRDVHADVILGADGPLADRLLAHGATVRVLPLPDVLRTTGDSALRGSGRARAAVRLAARGVGILRATRRYTHSLRVAIDDLEPDVVYSNAIKTHLLGSAAVGTRRPVLWHVRDFLGARPVVSRALRGVRRRVSSVIAVSGAVAADVGVLLPDVHTDVIHNGIDTQHFAPSITAAADLDALSGLPSAPMNTVRVGLVATYARWKGHDLFVEAIARVRSRRPELPLRAYVIGGPIYATPGSQVSTAELKAMLESAGVTECVGLVPFVSDPRAVYAALDLVVHSSTRPEPFGRTIVEAMASGRAVIATLDGGVPEIVRDDVDALGVPPRDANALSDAIARLAASPELRTRLGESGRISAASHFGRPRLGRQVRAALERCATSATRGGAACHRGTRSTLGWRRGASTAHDTKGTM